MTKAEANSWGKKVIEQFGEVADLKNDKFIILAGQDYLTPIQNSLTNIEEPLKGVGMFDRPQKLKELIKKINGK